MPKTEDFIRGNENLKKPNATQYVTEDIQQEYINEIIKCKDDIIYFAEKFFTIISPAKGKHTIKLYEKQKVLIRAMVDNTRVISLASRQVGKTTSYTIFGLHQTIFFPEKKVLIAANKKDTALEILGRIQMAYECLPNWLKPGVIDYNKGKVKFSNLSEIQGVATGSSSARGFSAGILILDEFAFVNPPSVVTQFWNSVYPVVSSDKKSKVIVVSTPNGVGNMYHTLWEKSQGGTSDDEGERWTGIRIDWWDVPGRDEQWKKQQLEALGTEAFQQEFENSFLSSATPKLISDRLIQKFRMFQEEHDSFGKEYTLELYDDKSFQYTVYHEPRDDRSYLLSFDVADGVGKDSSVAYVWDVTDMADITMCARFSDNNTATNEFAYVIDHMSRQYNDPWLAGESNSIGKAVIDILQIIYKKTNFVSMNKGRPGILSHAQIKSKACRFAKEFLANQTVNVNIYDRHLINEMEYFAQKNTLKHVLYEAMKGKHDDHIISFIWALYVLSDKYLENYFTVLQFTKSELGGVIPRYIQSLLNMNMVNTDTRSLLDKEWVKQRTKDNKYLQQQREIKGSKQLTYFERKPDRPGVLGMMDREERMEDKLGGNATFFMGGTTEEW